MLTFFRNIRIKLFKESKLSRYLLYAIGEIVLVVLGILIAIQINDWNRENKLLKDELETYDIIVQDLKRDSILFIQYENYYSNYLNTFFELNKIKNEDGSFKDFVPDYIGANVDFNPATQKNHQSSIEKFRNKDIRSQINLYFRRLNQVHQATEEYNNLIESKSRPFFIEEQNIFDNSKVFDYDDRTFPPFKRVSVIDTAKLRQAFNEKYFTPILSELRMAIGFYLTALELGQQENHKLIQQLTEEIDKH